MTPAIAATLECEESRFDASIEAGPRRKTARQEEPRPYPLETLLVKCFGRQENGKLHKGLYKILDIHPRTWHRRWRGGHAYLTVYEADDFATRLSYHPNDVWPEWRDDCFDLDSLEDLDEVLDIANG